MGWLFLNQWFGLYLRWPFPNSVSTPLTMKQWLIFSITAIQENAGPLGRGRLFWEMRRNRQLLVTNNVKVSVSERVEKESREWYLGYVTTIVRIMKCDFYSVYNFPVDSFSAFVLCSNFYLKYIIFLPSPITSGYSDKITMGENFLYHWLLECYFRKCRD